MNSNRFSKWQIHIASVSIFCLILSMSVFSQQNAVSNNKVINNDLPSLHEVESRVKRKQIGGLKVAFLNRKKTDASVVFRLKLRFGNEKALMNRDVAGDFAGQLLMRGTKKHTRQQIKDEFERLKAKVDVSGDATSSWASIQTTRQNLPAVFKLVGEILREPAFPESEFTKLKEEVLMVVGKFKTNSQSVAGRAMGIHMNVYPKGHPMYSGSLEGSLQSIGAVTLDEAKSFYKDFYGASNGEMTIVGDFDEEEITKLTKDIFADWKSPQKFKPIKHKYKYIKPVDKTISFQNEEPAHLTARLNLLLNINHPDYPALLIGTKILGNPSSDNSRLAKRIPQTDGSKDKIMSVFFASQIDSFGGFLLFGNFAPENLEKIEITYRDELKKMLEHGFTAEEVLEAKKAWLKTREGLRTDDNRLAGHLNQQLFLNRTLEWDVELEQKIESLTPEKINAAMKKHIKLEDISVVKAGNFPKLREKQKKQ